jgi:hypothetical protein
MILSHLPLVWRIHTAQPNTPQSVFSADTDALIESLKTVHYLVWSRWAEHCAP